MPRRASILFSLDLFFSRLRDSPRMSSIPPSFRILFENLNCSCSALHSKNIILHGVELIITFTTHFYAVLKETASIGD